MDWLESHLLSTTIFLPFVWSLIGLLIPSTPNSAAAAGHGDHGHGAHGGHAPASGGGMARKTWTLMGALVTFALSLKIYLAYQAGGPEFQMTEMVEWIPGLGISYSLGVDGISAFLLLLTGFLMPIVVLASFNAVETREKEYYFLLLALETGMMGAFVALDVFLFYVFWEVMLIPMYLLIGIWGGKDRIYAAMKFFLYTMVGSLLMLVAIFFLAYQHKMQFGNYSTAIVDLYRLKLDGTGWFGVQEMLFLAFALAFAIKVPLFPLHTWLPDAHVQAPTAGSVILAGVLLKMGGYGFIRFAFPMFPAAVAQYQSLFMILGTIAIVYGAWVATVQPDVKKLVAYSSVSHMGYVVVGLFSLNAIGAMGSIYQMFSHGVATGGLFLLIGMIYERRHTREIKDYGGIARVMPLYAVALIIMTLAAVALPGTNGFVGEFLILLGTFKANPGLGAIAATGVIFGAVYMLWMIQRVMFGPIKNPENEKLVDLSGREMLVLAPLVIAVFVMGVFPTSFFNKMEPSVQRFLNRATVTAVVQRTIGLGPVLVAAAKAPVNDRSRDLPSDLHSEVRN